MNFRLRGLATSVGRWLDGHRNTLELSTPAGGELVLDRPLPTAPGALAAAVPVAAAPQRGAGPQGGRRLLATVFDSSHPVRTRAELFGRDRELDDLLSAALDFRQHSVVHGARGSGKTSLVRVFGDFADQNGVVVIYMACEPGVGFADLLRPYLRSIPPAALATGAKERFRQELAALPDQFSPRAFVELVAETVSAPLVLIFDEFDRIVDPAVKADIAAAMKLLSDALSSVLFMLVGIARNVSDVVESHPSLRRHMRTVSIGRIEPASVDALIDRGAAAAGLAFGADARALIARAACGSPFHVRMFCHHAGLAALRRGSPQVEAADARAGFETAYEVWGGMNEDDAETFGELVRDRASRPELERVARAAAIGDGIADGHSDARAPALDMLGGALSRDGGNGAFVAFRDSVAPQFLIALIILMEGAPDRARQPAMSQESHDAHYR